MSRFISGRMKGIFVLLLAGGYAYVFRNFVRWPLFDFFDIRSQSSQDLVTLLGLLPILALASYAGDLFLRAQKEQAKEKQARQLLASVSLEKKGRGKSKRGW